MDYLNFDLEITQTATGYRAKVLDSPAGQASATFVLPFSELEVENLILRMGGSVRTMRRIDSPQFEAARNFGGQLFETLFDGEVRLCLTSSLGECERAGKGLRLRLRMAEAAKLIDLPWEYLYDSAANRFLALSVQTPVVRFLEMPGSTPPLAISPPLHVVAVIASPSDFPALDVEAEWTKVQQAAQPLIDRGLMVLHRLEKPTLAALQQSLRQQEVHVLHFVGHGGFDSTADDGLLMFEDETGRGRPVSGLELGTLLYDEKSLRLAVLNACEGARTGRTDPFAGVAQSLIQQGIPAVIAMQFAVSDQAAIGLAASFYAALADGYPVDAALTEARKSLFTQDSGAEWGTPVLYLRAADGRIFDLQASPALPAETPPRSAPPAPEVPAQTSPRRARPPLLWMGAGVALVMVIALIFAWRGGGGTAPPAPPTPVATVLFPFAPTDTPWQGDPAQWKIVPVGSGSFAYQGSGVDTDTAAAPPDTDLFLGWTDYELAMQVRVVQAGLPNDDLPDLWLTVRHDPGKTTGCGGYNLSLDGYWRKAVISPISNAECPWVALAETTIGLDVGGWHPLRVRAEGDHLQMWLDEQLVGDAHDGRSTSGFFFLNVGAGAVVQFRQVQASRLR